MPPLFRSFFQAGFECSTHKLKNGKRLDLLASTQHDRFLREDYARLEAFGIATVREGIRWHLIEKGGEFDFTSVKPFLRESRLAKIQVIWDIFHFGWPDELDIFSAAWVEEFTRFAGSFAELLRDEGEMEPLITPVNEISFFAWAGGDVAYLNPFQTGRGPELKTQLVKAWIAAAAAIRQVLPKAILASAEPVIHIAGDPERPSDDLAAEAYRQSMFEAWDMILGRSHPELGGSEEMLDVVGVNFYDRNQWVNFGRTIRREDPDYRPFHKILEEVYQRYRRPLFVSETGTEDEDRPAWLAYIAEQVQEAVSLGVPVEGVCLYPILNHPGWDDDRHCHNGLWDYPSPSGERIAYRPLGDEIHKQQVRIQTGVTCPTT